VEGSCSNGALVDWWIDRLKDYFQIGRLEYWQITDCQIPICRFESANLEIFNLPTICQSANLPIQDSI
jgi:hypothetical protein